MDSSVQGLQQAVLEGHRISLQEAGQLLAADKQELYRAADDLRRHFLGNHFHLCSIINAKSGNCSENCRFCAQSARHHTGIETYTVIPDEEAMTIALDNDQHGVHRLSLVTSGRSLSLGTLEELTGLYAQMSGKTSLQFCASTGFLDEETSKGLRAAGVSRYHCNLEACRDFFPEVCTSHSWQEKTETLKLARQAGMSLCSGGIIGMGESVEHRIALALELRELEVKSIPINVLTPIPGTPLAALQPLSLEEVLATIALFRFINPDAVILMAGGRQQLGSDQYQCFAAGANGAIVGNYLTTGGNSIAEDLERLADMGFSFDRH